MQEIVQSESAPLLDDKGRSYATGKRKNSIARVWLKKGDGKISINGQTLNKYFSRPVLQMVVNQPLELINSENEYKLETSNNKRQSQKQHKASIVDRQLSKVYINLIDQKEPSLDFISGYQDNNDVKFKSTTNYSKKIIKPSDKEKTLHKEYLKNSLKKNYFN